MRFLKTLCLLGLVLLGRELAAQPYPFTVGIHANRLDLGDAATGAGVSLQVSHLYFDISSNFARGEGPNKQRSTHDTYIMEKLRAGLVNVGYVIPVKRFYLIPKVGVAWTFDIWQTPDPTPSFYLYNEKNILNAGLTAGYKVTDKLGVQVNGGLFERFSVGLTWYLGDF